MQASRAGRLLITGCLGVHEQCHFLLRYYWHSLPWACMLWKKEMTFQGVQFGQSSIRVLVQLRCLSSPNPDLEKRKNPVCHFVTPLDGSADVDEHRRPEVFNQEVIA